LKRIFVIASFSFQILTYSQTLKGVVVDSISNEKLQYANLSLKGKAIGTYSNENGSYILDISKASNKDSLIISLIGYKKQILSLHNFVEAKDYEINLQLSLKPELLNEVLIVSKKKYSTNKITISTGTKKGIFPSSVTYGREVATLLQNKENKKGKIQELILKFKKPQNKDFKIYQTYYRITFYKVNDLGQPGELLDYENIIIKPKDDDPTYKLNLEGKNIEFDENGVFVGIETVKPSNVKLESSMYLTTPNLLYTHTKLNLTFTRFGSNEWTKKNRKSVFKKKFYKAPFLKLKVVYIKK
jgi:hypothetical protein